MFDATPGNDNHFTFGLFPFHFHRNKWSWGLSFLSSNNSCVWVVSLGYNNPFAIFSNFTQFCSQVAWSGMQCLSSNHFRWWIWMLVQFWPFVIWTYHLFIHLVLRRLRCPRKSKLYRVLRHARACNRKQRVTFFFSALLIRAFYPQCAVAGFTRNFDQLPENSSMELEQGSLPRWLNHVDCYTCHFHFFLQNLLLVDFCFDFPPKPFSPCLGYPGEGPVAEYFTLNVTSLPKRLHSILQFLNSNSNAQVMCLQETRAPPQKMSALQNLAFRAGWSLHVGFQPPFKRISGVSTCFRQPTGGLAILVNRQTPSIQLELPDDWRHLHEVCMPVWLSMQHGRNNCGVVLINCYLPSGSLERERRESLLRDILAYASTFSTPAILCGDFQSEPDQSQALSLAQMSGAWTDFYAEHRNSQSKPVEATFCAKGWKDGFIGFGKTRIDHMFLNAVALTAAKEARIFRGPLAPGHAPVSATLEHVIFSSEYWTLPRLPKWFLPPRPSDKREWDDRNNLCLPVFHQFLPKLIEFAETLQVEQFWRLTCDMIHDMLNCICQQHVSSSRGSVPDFEKHCVTPLLQEGLHSKSGLKRFVAYFMNLPLK